jgi:hypothetical protein
MFARVYLYVLVGAQLAASGPVALQKRVDCDPIS